jgi:plasmid stability protein
MAAITIRNLDDELKRRLRIRAAEHGRSMEEEVREILQAGLTSEPMTGAELYVAIRMDVDAAGGGIKLDPLLRTPVRDPPDFSGPEWGTYDDE